MKSVYAIAKVIKKICSVIKNKQNKNIEWMNIAEKWVNKEYKN